MVKLDLIQAFMAIVETHSFNAAGKRLNKSTAAISQKIGLLESHLKVELIQRDTRNVVITPIGVAYYEQCRRILTEMERADKLIKSQHEAPYGQLTIACPVKSLIPKIAEFKTHYPDIELIIDSSEKWPDVKKHKIDIIVGTTLQSPPEYVRKKIGTVRYTLCATETYFKKHGKPNTPHDLVHHQYLAHTGRLNNKQLKFKGDLLVPVTPWLWLNSIQAILACVQNHLGIALLHNIVTNEYIKRGELIELFSELQEEEALCVYYPYHEYLEPKIKTFLKFLNTVFE